MAMQHDALMNSKLATEQELAVVDAKLTSASIELDYALKHARELEVARRDQNNNRGFWLQL